MLRILVALSVIALSQAGNLFNGGYGGYGSELGGLRGGYGSEGAYGGEYAGNYGPIPYAFAYSAQGHDGGSSREESSDGHGGVRGSYTLDVADGRKRLVRYVADHAGYRAEIETNEPGTESQSPAATSVHSSQPPAAELAYRVGGYGHGISESRSDYGLHASAPLLGGYGGSAYRSGW